MQKILLILFLLISFLPIAYNQSGQFISHKSLSKKIALKLKRDADRLSLRLSSTGEDLKFKSVEIPRDESISIFNALVAIHTSDLATAKSVAHCKIHTIPQPSIDNFTIIYHKGIGWADPLKNGLNETTNERFNDVLETYDLYIVNHVEWDERLDAITLQSSKHYNMAALANQFHEIEGIEKVELKQKSMDGKDVEISRVSGAWKITYLLKWGTCVDGCNNLYSWEFEVKDNGEVKFIKEKGQALPNWLKCEKPSSYIVMD